MAIIGKRHTDVAFGGSGGIDVRRGSFAGNFEVARVAEQMAAIARRVVAGNSKLGVLGAAREIKVTVVQENTSRGGRTSRR